MAKAKNPNKKSANATAKPDVSDRKPRADFNAIKQAGLKAHGLAVEHRSEIEPRVAGGLIDGLFADANSLTDVVTTTQLTHDGAKDATRTQDAAIDALWAKVSAIRFAVDKTKTVTPESKKKYGVGDGSNCHLVKDVKGAAKKILKRAGEAPDEARGCKILPKDLDELKTLDAALTTADDEQEHERAAAPRSTKERNEAANRVLHAIDEISAAGVIAFPHDKKLRPAFENLKPKTGGTTKTDSTTGGGTSGTSTT